MYAFVHIDKTAGTTLKAILRRSFGTAHCDIRLPMAKRRDEGPDHRTLVDAADLKRVKRLYRNLRGIAGHNVRAYSDLAAECPDIRYFTVLREPVARFRSHYLNRALGPSPQRFERWLSLPWVRNWQTRMIAGEANAEKAIDLLATRFGFIGLTERFDETLVMLERWLGEPRFRPEYRRLNQFCEKRRHQRFVANKTDLSYMDTPDARARIEEANAEDRKVYDFVISTLYPREQAAYRRDLEEGLRALERRNQAGGRLVESVWSRFLRNYVYKPLIHCHAV